MSFFDDNQTFQDPSYYPIDYADDVPSSQPDVDVFQFMDSSSEDSDSPPPVATDPSEQSIHITDLANLRTVVGTVINHPGGNLSTHLHNNFKGLIILPIECIGQLRYPNGAHRANPSVLIYLPTDGPENHPSMTQFNQALQILYPPTNSLQ